MTGTFTHLPVLDLESLGGALPQVSTDVTVVRFQTLALNRWPQAQSVQETQWSLVWDNPGALANLKGQGLGCEPSPCTLEREPPLQVRADLPQGWPGAPSSTSPQALLVHG